MIDIISRYKKRNLIKNTWIVATSLILALWINFLVWDTSLWKKLQISVINSWENNVIWDVYLEKNENGMNLIASKDMLKVKSISLSIAYNPNSLKIDTIKSSIDWNLINEENDKWLITLVLNAKFPLDIKKGDSLFNINAIKTQEKIENINIINANFTDLNNQVYLLSSSWVEY